MLSAAIAISPNLEKRLSKAISRKRDLLCRVRAGDTSRETLNEIAELDLLLSRFGESVFHMALAQQGERRNTETPWTIH